MTSWFRQVLLITPRLALLMLCLLPARAAVILLDVKVPMRDGIHLSTNIFLPSDHGRWPTVMQRTPYTKASTIAAGLKMFLDSGYAVVLQDVRGRGKSGGLFQQVTQELPDGEDTLKWIAAQKWSDGRIGMFGGSYPGITVWRGALSKFPGLKAISVSVSGGDEYIDRYYSRGGAFKVAHRNLWIAQNFRMPGRPVPSLEKLVEVVPLRSQDKFGTGRTLSFFQEAMDHPLYDDYWKAMSTRRNIDQIQTPALIVSGWFDNYCESDVDMYAALRSLNRPARLVIGPWGHNLSSHNPTVDFGPIGSLVLRKEEIDWFNAYIKGEQPSPPSGVQYFLLGANEWRGATEWPPKAKLVPYYLSSQKSANSVDGDGTLELRPPDRKRQPMRFTYDPQHPVPTRGGAICCDPKLFPWGPFDQGDVEKRKDVLVFTSKPFKEDTEITGPVTGVLNVSTSAPDTDFTVKLVDVSPDGHAQNLCDGLLRLRYRQGLDKIAPYKPGEVVRIVVQAGVTGNLFRSGHRLRVEISSSNFPRFDRNPNTGRPVASETELRPAEQSVYQDRAHASYILLPLRIAGPGKPSLP